MGWPGTGSRGRKWCLPSASRYEALRLLLPGLDRPLDELAEEHEGLWSAYRREWDRIRAPFELPPGVTNVWDHPHVQGPERLVGADGKPLHPCQKPLVFARRIVEASTRPGELVLEPFGGTFRVAVACEDIARADPAKARRYLCIEADEDGRDYTGHVVAWLRGERAPSAAATGQIRLF